MTTTAGDTTQDASRSQAAAEAPSSPILRILRVLAGSLLTLLTLPVILLFDLPVSAWVIGASLVLANALLHSIIAWLVRDSSVTVTLGAMGFSMLARAGVTVLVLFFVGAQISGVGADRLVGMGRPDLARIAIVVFLIGFTLDALIDTLRRASERDSLKSATPVQETTA